MGDVGCRPDVRCQSYDHTSFRPKPCFSAVPHPISHLSSFISPLSSLIYYLLSVIYYLLSAICYLLSIIYYLLSIICYLLSIICYLLSAICYLLSIIYYLRRHASMTTLLEVSVAELALIPAWRESADPCVEGDLELGLAFGSVVTRE